MVLGEDQGVVQLAVEDQIDISGGVCGGPEPGGSGADGSFNC